MPIAEMVIVYTRKSSSAEPNIDGLLEVMWDMWAFVKVYTNEASIVSSPSATAF